MIRSPSLLRAAFLTLVALCAIELSLGPALAQFDVSGGRSIFDGSDVELPYDNGVRPRTVPIITDNGLQLIEGLSATPEPGFGYSDVPSELKAKLSPEEFKTLMRGLFENRPLEVPGIGPLIFAPSASAGGGYQLQALSLPGYQTGAFPGVAPAEPPLVVGKAVIGLVNSGSQSVGFRIEMPGQQRVLIMAAGEVRTFECEDSCTGGKVTYNRSGAGTETANDIALGKLYRFRQGPEGWSLSD